MKWEQRRESGTGKRWKEGRNDCVGTDAACPERSRRVRPASKASVRAKIVARARTSRFLGYAFGMTTSLDWNDRESMKCSPPPRANALCIFVTRARDAK